MLDPERHAMYQPIPLSNYPSVRVKRLLKQGRQAASYQTYRIVRWIKGLPEGVKEK